MYADQGNYPEEIKNYYAALKIYEKLGDKKNIGNTLQYIGAGYETQDNFTDALINVLL
jgi:tetratricopeptide (TPR) repeat protein